MKRLVVVFSFLAASGVMAQDRSAQLDKAYEEARAAYNALQQAETRRDQGVEPQPGERLGTATGASRPSERYFRRQALLEQDVERARKRHEAALKRWNELK